MRTLSLRKRDIHLIKATGWSYQSDFHLELSDQEKVKVMLKARKSNCDVIECHSHRFNGEAIFSYSDNQGLEEFVQYIWWKLPDKIYGAVVFTKSDLRGQIWLPKEIKPKIINEIEVIKRIGEHRVINSKFAISR